jgi:hypothetical protein
VGVRDLPRDIAGIVIFSLALQAHDPEDQPLRRHEAFMKVSLA